MSLTEHLQELRRRVVVSLLAILAGTIVGFIWYQWAPGPVMPLGELIRRPYCSLPPELRADLTADGSCRLIATTPFEMFMLRMKVGFLAGLVFASPVWLYQIWAFITPGLHKNERRWTLSFVSLAVTLFVSGAVIAYFIVDQGLELLMSIGKEYQIAALSGQLYYNFVLALIVIFGVSFEVPLVVIMLNLAGLLRYDQVRDKRRIIIVALFIFAAVITPGQDPFSMVVLALSLTLLVELAFQFCRIHDKRAGIRTREWAELDDEEASGPIDAPAPIGAASGLGTANAIDRPAPISTDAEPDAGGYGPTSISGRARTPNFFDDVL
ncbi:sec-independent protein translocase protein TatC [Corynebacterium appendicis CIP 107643]|uniref:Sec-independent protein translocase protein TatC n=1 Tax=Corynebacterium appendicis CIP 107643 TaxID=1161099 RepID=A0A1N7IWT0_9CORY|nr:twin-arginine translocase subunit TatC [Corynebacterium appendicis]WJY61110.1 Sec-independent protein translocase protein TatC [Corynebacterium appendicis CIP 107643]SIS41540.1 sec-independent protein translocase protein TatC [Corynebacterium appendicis CIP 107643]